VGFRSTTEDLCAVYSIINGATQYNDYIYFAETVTISKLISRPEYDV